MKLSTQTTAVFTKLGEDEGLRVFGEAGYDALDYSMFMISRDRGCVWHSDGWREHARELREKCESLEMYFNQGHAPFQYRFGDAGEYENRFIPDTLKSVELAGLLGIRNLIVHPVHHFVYAGHEEEIHEKNMVFYRGLIPAAEEYGVKISVENMWQNDPVRRYPTDDVGADPAELCAYVDELNSYAPVFNACLDIGHVPLVRRDPSECIRVLGSRLSALHIHDNRWVGDDHTVPGLGQIDFNSVIKALRDVNYTGEFTFEADAFFYRFEKPFVPKVVKFMADIGRYWTDKFDASEQ